MIDTVNLVWGNGLGTALNRTPRSDGSHRMPPAWTFPEVRLDIDQLIDRFGSDDGEVTTKRYGGKEYRAGHWKQGHVELLYSPGRVELRASLPKLLTGGNEVVLDESGVHEALRRLAARGSELVEHPLPLRQADAKRIDHVYQWEVQSVAWALEHLRAALPSDRRKVTWIESPKGGRSLVHGYGGRRVIRFYDKVGEILDKGEDPGGQELDTILRYEIQDRRRPSTRSVHEGGYTAEASRHELAKGVQKVGALALHGLEEYLDARGGKYGLAFGLAAFALAENPELWPLVRKRTSKAGVYRWKKRAREVALSVGDWAPTIPPDAFTAGATLWDEGQIRRVA